MATGGEASWGSQASSPPLPRPCQSTARRHASILGHRRPVGAPRTKNHLNTLTHIGHLRKNSLRASLRSDCCPLCPGMLSDMNRNGCPLSSEYASRSSSSTSAASGRAVGCPAFSGFECSLSIITIIFPKAVVPPINYMPGGNKIRRARLVDPALPSCIYWVEKGVLCEKTQL